MTETTKALSAWLRAIGELQELKAKRHRLGEELDAKIANRSVKLGNIYVPEFTVSCAWSRRELVDAVEAAFDMAFDRMGATFVHRMNAEDAIRAAISAASEVMSRIADEFNAAGGEALWREQSDAEMRAYAREQDLCRSLTTATGDEFRMVLSAVAGEFLISDPSYTFNINGWSAVERLMLAVSRNSKVQMAA
jgi:hypothetical protein